MRGEIRQPGDEHLKLIADYLRLTLDEVRALRRQAAPSRDPLSRQSSLRRIAALEREVRELRSETERLVSRLEQIARRLDGDSPNE
jgi:predicted  nucleic acid-binding Zn-ribbon protein